MDRTKRTLLLVGNPRAHPSSTALLERLRALLNEAVDQVQVLSAAAPAKGRTATWTPFEVRAKWFPAEVFEATWRFMASARRLASLPDAAIVLPVYFPLILLVLRIWGIRTACFLASWFPAPIRILVRLSVRLSHLVICESDQTARLWGYAPDQSRVFVSGFIADNTFFRAPSIDSHPDCVSFIGRLAPGKGILEFLQAAVLVLREQPNTHFLVAGDGPLRSRAAEFVVQNGLESRIQFLGWVEREFLPNVLGRTLLLVIPSSHEGAPNVAFEAMGLGVPILATPVGMIPEVIRDGETGFLLPGNSPVTIAENIRRALNSGRLEEISVAARRLIEQGYGYESSLRKWQEIVGRLLV